MNEYRVRRAFEEFCSQHGIYAAAAFVEKVADISELNRAVSLMVRVAPPVRTERGRKAANGLVTECLAIEKALVEFSAEAAAEAKVAKPKSGWFGD